MPDEKSIRVATPVDLIILNERNKILLLKRKEKEDQFVGHWSIPGGGPEAEETFDEALRREVKEEIGCTISEINYFMSFFFKVNEHLHVRSIYFYGKIQGEIAFNKEEFSDFKWFDFSEIENENLKVAFNQKGVLQEFISFWKKKERMENR